jgi:uncharacterized membrane protein YecN with MAPEG domain
MSSLPAIVTCLALLLYSVFIARVALARGKYNIPAPATTGHPAFERAFRIQNNTGEQLIIMLPGLWLFSIYVSPLWAFLLGLLWIVGRIVYAIGYTRNPEARALGFVIGFAANVVLVLGSLGAAILQYMHGGM